MEKDARIQDLEDSLRNNCPTLFLGAGFSREAVCGSGILCNAADGKRNERQLAVSGDADCVFGD